MPKLPDNPPGIRVLKTIESQRLKENFPDPSKLPPSPKTCITCGGTTQFKWWDDRFENLIEWDCRCDAQWLLHRYFLYNGVSINFQRIGWRHCQSDPNAVQIVRNYIHESNLGYNINVGTGLYLYGPPGTGKSLLSTLLLRRSLAEGHTGHFTTFVEMKDAYTGAWHDQEKSEWYQQKIRNASVLVIDDPGKEMGSGNAPEMARSILDDMIRHRMYGSLPTIITSNDTPEAFRSRYGGSVDSLISERMIPVRVDGADWRPQMLPTAAEERQAGITRPIVIS